MPFANPIPRVPGPAKLLSRSRDQVMAPCAGPQRPWRWHCVAANTRVMIGSDHDEDMQDIMRAAAAGAKGQTGGQRSLA